MRNTIIHIFAIIILTFLCQKLIGLPWWTVYVIPFLTCYLFEKKESRALLIGFVSILIFWGALSFLIDNSNDSLLSSKISGLFGGIGSWGLIVLTAIFGGIVGAIGGWTGVLLRMVLNKTEKK